MAPSQHSQNARCLERLRGWVVSAAHARAVTCGKAHLEALAGSSLRVLSARQATKPPRPTGMMGASLPPTTMTSASPARMWFAAATNA